MIWGLLIFVFVLRQNLVSIVASNSCTYIFTKNTSAPAGPSVCQWGKVKGQIMAKYKRSDCVWQYFIGSDYGYEYEIENDYVWQCMAESDCVRQYIIKIG